MHDLIQTATGELAGFLLTHLPAFGDDWWTTHVETHLSRQQQRRVQERGVRTLDQLDFAALLGVFDGNCYELSHALNLPREGRNWTKELQTVRNKWAHLSAQTVPASDVYRDADTLGRFLDMLGAERESVVAVEATKTAALDKMAVARNVARGSSASVEETRASADQEMPVHSERPASLRNAMGGHDNSMERMTRSAAIKRVNDLQHDATLDKTNTCFSNVNSARAVWWFNIPPEKFERDLHLLCAGKDGLIWLTIGANSIPNPGRVFRLRPDNGKIDLEISCAPERYMRDVKSGGTGYDFRSHIRQEWSWK